MPKDRVRYFEFCQGKSQKFWEITLHGSGYCNNGSVELRTRCDLDVCD